MQAKRTVTLHLLKGAALLALPLAVFCTAVPALLPAAISSDPAVGGRLLALAPWASASIFLCTMDVCCEGLLVARKRLPLLITSMCAVLLAVAAYFYAGNGATLSGTWAGLLLFFAPRSVLSFTTILSGLFTKRGW